MPETISLPIKKLDSRAIVPSVAYEGDAGIDLRSLVDITLEPFERTLVPTGLAVAIPQGYGGFVLPRSGSAFKQGLSLGHAPGLRD
ncbi:MAG: dUTP diphosphatase, partial [Eggerthellaceae bacterium]|nr:dUTP diphosphatase [Eggerthellaceae bacterium]